MAHTTSWAFPNMIDTARNCVNIAEDNQSVTNRTKLLMLTEPTELYNEPKFGVGLKQFLWQYNTENARARIRDRIIEQLRLYEPSVDSTKTSFADGLLFTEDAEHAMSDPNTLKMTVGLMTIYGDELEVTLNDSQDVIDARNM